MKLVYQLQLKINQYILSSKNIYESLLWAALTIALLLMSFLSDNSTIQLVAGIFGGFAFGVFLIKMQPVLDYLKSKWQKA